MDLSNGNKKIIITGLKKPMDIHLYDSSVTISGIKFLFLFILKRGTTKEHYLDVLKVLSLLKKLKEDTPILFAFETSILCVRIVDPVISLVQKN